MNYFEFLRGALGRWENEDGSWTALRFTEGQMRLYAADAGYHVRSLASAGMCWDCETDAEALHVAGCTREGSSQDVWGFDLLVNGALFAHREGSIAQEPDFDWRVALPKGTKRVQLFFPCLAETRLRELSLSGESFARKPVYDCRLLCLGDSITQGYTVHFPSLAYANGLALALNAECLNQSIAGETFNPKMVDGSIALQPDRITIAYGTNDWNCKTREQFTRDAEDYVRRVRESWPAAEIFVITPIWRGDTQAHPERFAFVETETILEKIATQHNAKTICGAGLFPAVKELTADGFLHPNDLGHQVYAQRLAKAMRR